MHRKTLLKMQNYYYEGNVDSHKNNLTNAENHLIIGISSKKAQFFLNNYSILIIKILLIEDLFI